MLPPPPAVVTVLDTDVVSAGYGSMRGTGTGSISVSGVSGTVTKALLYWHGPTTSSSPRVNATVTFAGHAATAANSGCAYDNSWAVANSQSYPPNLTSPMSCTS